jgi:hypothetical protein
MIASVIQYDSILAVWDENGSRIGTLSIGDGEMIGFANTFILLRYSDMIITIDYNQRQLGSIVLPESFDICGITNNGFLAKSDSLLQVYDSWCRHIGVQSI